MIVTSTRERQRVIHRLALDARPFELLAGGILRYGLVLFLIGGGFDQIHRSRGNRHPAVGCP